MTRLARLARRPLQPRLDQIYEELHAKIVKGDLRPGESLTETRIADLYGVSRTPIREVFRRLSEEGFLRIIPQVGTFVAPINLAAVRDSQFIRETLECRAVTLAAANATPDEIHLLERELEFQRRAIARADQFGFFASDETLHRLLMTIAGRPRVWSVIASAKAQLDRVRYLSLEKEDWLAMVFAQHETLVERVARHDAAGAATVMREHLQTAFGAVERIAAEHSDFFESDDEPLRAGRALTSAAPA